MSVLVIAGSSLRRYLRDRVALFFVVVLPVLVIVIIGATVSGMGKLRIGLVDHNGGPLGQGVVAALEASPALEVHHLDSEDAARTAVRRGEVSLAVVLPADFDDRLRAGTGATVTMIGDRTTSAEPAAESAVSAAVGAQAAKLQAAAFASTVAGGTLDANLGLTDAAASQATPIRVEQEAVGAERRILPEGFSYSAPTMLVLFVFINALAGGAAIIRSRQLGMYERMLAAPLSARSVVLGETLCYLSLALLQSVLIVVVGAVAFGVSWGDPLAATALIAVWALVGTGTGVVSGTLFKTPEQASSIGPSLGIAFGMLGGTMWPLEMVPSVMRTIGHAFPHAWAVDAWTALLARGAGITDIATELAVLTGFAVVLLAAATTRLRHTIAI